jgi:hypothetical protein
MAKLGQEFWSGKWLAHRAFRDEQLGHSSRASLL